MKALLQRVYPLLVLCVVRYVRLTVAVVVGERSICCRITTHPNTHAYEVTRNCVIRGFGTDWLTQSAAIKLSSKPISMLDCSGIRAEPRSPPPLAGEGGLGGGAAGGLQKTHFRFVSHDYNKQLTDKSEKWERSLK